METADNNRLPTQTSSSSQTQQNLSPLSNEIATQGEVSLRVNGKQAAITDIQRWFAVSNITHYARQPHNCFFRDVPTLIDITKAAGVNTTKAWLVTVLAYINMATTAEIKMNKFQMEQCAESIMANYGSLKLTEIMLFASRLVGGRYGKIFYNSVDPIAITGAISEHFMPERYNAYNAYYSAVERRKQEEEARNTPPPTEEELQRIEEIKQRLAERFGISNK